LEPCAKAWRKTYLEEGGLLGFRILQIIFEEIFSTFSSSSLKSKTANLLIEEDDIEDVD
jgi:hypothetical protein